MKKISAVSLLFGTALLWSLGGVLIKTISWHPLGIAGMRSLIALPMLLIVFRRRHLTFSRAQWGGAVGYTATLILFVCATKLTTAANATLLQYTAPIYVALFGALFLGEKARPLDWLVITAALGGIGLFFFDRLEPGHLGGNLLAILSGLTFAGMILCMRKQKTSFPLGSIFLGNILTVLICLPFMLRSRPNPEGWIFLIILGALQVGLAYIFYSAAIRWVTALEAIIIPMIEAVLNPIWVLLFVGERPGGWAVLGGILVLGSVVIRAVLTVRGKEGEQDSDLGTKS